MIKSKKLTALFTGTAAVLMLTGTSAFADSRHRAETNRGHDQQQAQQRESRTQNNAGRTWNRAQAQPPQRTWNRSQAQVQTQTQPRSYQRSQTYSQPSSQAYRFDGSNRANSYARPQAYRGSYNRAPVVHESRSYAGRVERYEPYRGGFRVWIGGAPYPFFVSANLWHRYGIRVGATLSLGGYWDPLGYYDVYNVGQYNDQTAGDLHGVVENIDYGRGTVVIRDDVPARSSPRLFAATIRGSEACAPATTSI